MNETPPRSIESELEELAKQVPPEAWPKGGYYTNLSRQRGEWKALQIADDDIEKLRKACEAKDTAIKRISNAAIRYISAFPGETTSGVHEELQRAICQGEELIK